MKTKERAAVEEVASENIYKKLEMLELSVCIEKELLITHDRIFFRADGRMVNALADLEAEGVMKTGRVSGGPHDMIFSISPLDRDGWRKSYRESRRPSLQVVIGLAFDGHYYGDRRHRPREPQHGRCELLHPHS